MLKKISALVLAMAVLAMSIVPAFGASTAGILKDDEAKVEVLADIVTKVSGKAGYVQGPITEYASQSNYPKFDFRANLDMQNVRTAFENLFGKYVTEEYLTSVGAITDASEIADLKSRLYVKGQMIVKVTYPNALKVPADFILGKNLYGFGATSGDMSVYKEVKRDEAIRGDRRILTITVDIPAVAATLLESDTEKYLSDLYLESLGNRTSKTGTYTVTGEVNGYTDIILDVDGDGAVVYEAMEDPDLKIDTIVYNAIQDPSTGDNEISATVIVKSKGGSSSSGGGNGGGSLPGKTEPTPVPEDDEVEVTFSVNGDTTVIPGIKGDDGVTVDLDEIKIEEEEGYVTTGKWYTDPGCTNEVSGKQTFGTDTTLYTKHTNVTPPAH